MTLKDSIKADVLGVFLDVNEFAELITYLPRKGGRRAIRAIVDRSPPAVYDAAGNVVLPEYVITVKNCCKSGISSKEVEPGGGDRVELPENLNDTSKTTRAVMVLKNHDEGMIELALM